MTQVPTKNYKGNVWSWSFIAAVALSTVSMLGNSIDQDLAVHFPLFTDLADLARPGDSGTSSTASFSSGDEGNYYVTKRFEPSRIISARPWIPGTNSFTVATLFKFGSVNSFGTDGINPTRRFALLSAEELSFSQGYRLWLFSTNGIEAGLSCHVRGRVDFPGGDKAISSAPISPDRWHHGAMTVDRSARRLSLYVDGRNAGETSIESQDIRPTGFWIGGYPERPILQGPWTGDGGMADVRIYSRALTASEIALLAANAFTRQSQASNAAVVWSVTSDGQTRIPTAARGYVKSVAMAGLCAALLEDGSVLSWRFQAPDVLLPVPAAAQGGVKAIAAGTGHIVALKEDGSVVAWGDSSGGPTKTNIPLSYTGVAAIAAGNGSTLTLKGNGTLAVWGSNPNGETNVPTGIQGHIKAVAAGHSHVVALTQDGTPYVWGANTVGQRNVPANAQNVVAIAAGQFHTVALKEDGSVIAWGANGAGQTSVPTAAQAGVIAIAAGGEYSAALKDDRSVVLWGSPNQTAVPLGLEGVAKIESNASSFNFVTALARLTRPAIAEQPASQVFMGHDICLGCAFFRMVRLEEPV